MFLFISFLLVGGDRVLYPSLSALRASPVHSCRLSAHFFVLFTFSSASHALLCMILEGGELCSGLGSDVFSQCSRGLLTELTIICCVFDKIVLLGASVVCGAPACVFSGHLPNIFRAQGHFSPATWRIHNHKMATTRAPRVLAARVRTARFRILCKCWWLSKGMYQPFYGTTIQ